MTELLDNRVRPATELWVAACALGGAWLLLKYPEHCFPIWPQLATLLGVVAALLGGLRMWQGLMVLHYRRGLRTLSDYHLTPQQLPTCPGRLFLGMGFHWGRHHSQRLTESRAPGSETLLAVATGSGDAALHGVGANAEHPVWVDEPERAGHTLVLGTTRVGKTRLAELLIAQDIRRGHCTIVLDPKGDPALFLRMVTEARRAGRLHRLRFFHLGFPQLSIGYNPVGEFGRITEVATRLAGQLPGQGNAAAFREFAWRFINIVARALKELGRTPDIRVIAHHLQHMDTLLLDYCALWLDRDGPADWRLQVANIYRQGNRAQRQQNPKATALASYLRTQNRHDEIADALLGILAYDRGHFEKLIASLLPLLEKLGSGETGRLLVPTADRPMLEWASAITHGDIVYVGLDALSDAEVASAVGNSMFADLTSLAGRLYKQDALADRRPRLPVSIHADEFNELVGPEFIPLLNKAGGAGIRITAYTQTLSDIEVGLDDLAHAEQAIGNLNSLIMLRVRDEHTATLLTRQLQEVKIYQRLTESRCTDGNANGVDFTSQTGDRMDAQATTLVTASDLVSLPRGHAFALLQGGRLYKLRLPLLAQDAPVPAGIEEAVRWCQAPP